MTDIKTRVDNAKKVVTGNVSMLDMLDASPATDLMNWGIDLAVRIAESTAGMDDATAEQNMEPRMKALRQFMRAAGNWAAGKFDIASRADLIAKLNDHWKAITRLDLPDGLENLLNQADDEKNTPEFLILKLKESLTPAE